MESITDRSLRIKARLAGVFQLLEAVTAGFGQVIVLDRLVVSGDAAATAANILGHERLFWLGFASSLIGVAFHIAWALLLYELLKPVNTSANSTISSIAKTNGFSKHPYASECRGLTRNDRL